MGAGLSDTSIGFLLAILGSVSFGAYILPRKLSTLPVIEYQYWLALVIAPISVLVAVIASSPLGIRTDLLLWCVFCGVLWTIGSLSYSSAVDNLGVARSTPVKNLAPVFASFYGIVIFKEYTLHEPKSLLMTLFGVLLMCAAAFLIGRVSALKHERALAFVVSRSAEERKHSFWWGMFYSLGAAFFYGAYSVPLKYAFQHKVTPYSACAWLGIGVLLSSILVFLLKTGRLIPRFPGARQLKIAQTAGAIWTAGQILGAAAMIYIPMSISWPVSNLSTLVAVAWGVWIFKEVHIEKHLREVLFGLVLYFAGLLLLAFAAPAGHV